MAISWRFESHGGPAAAEIPNELRPAPAGHAHKHREHHREVHRQLLLAREVDHGQNGRVEERRLRVRVRACSFIGGFLIVRGGQMR
eukprot:CAMPEP_0198227832 /NCGR_PEP_ID=MMETSP1445-20131203/110789_1 /TAXON_ID=36898 /ORGANISM="Pyramimonas sp., Strain CCMP2087" /LENGTH=85 /DNA_ID=CAMNT_0043908013 /DNA_START=64 /DNA_END=317 /DNA_ORIENTATION=+